MPTDRITKPLGTPRTVFNALQNENLVVDARSVESYDLSHAVGAQSVWNEDWELPEHRNAAIVYGETEDEMKAAEALVKERFPGIPDVRHWIGPFKGFETSYPAAVVAGSWSWICGHSSCSHRRPRVARVGAPCASFDLRGSLPEVIDAIDAGVVQARQTGRGGVLVHCYQGKSRSAAAVVGWLIAKRGVCLQDAMQLVTDSRKAVAMNEGFLRQLREFELSVRKL